MRYPLCILSLASLASIAAAQANAVPGTDVNLYDVSASTIYGRRGAAYPNGEVGVGFGHAFCNAGTVHVPWASSPTTQGLMTDVHFKIAFLLARESNGRIVQVSTPDSFVKHSRVTYNLGSSQCGTCQSGPGSTFRIGCYDAYSTGFNGNRFNLGPGNEIDPWTGSWNPVGSYFDRGDPAVVGPAASDGTQSLTSTQTNAFDPVKNRVGERAEPARRVLRPGPAGLRRRAGGEPWQQPAVGADQLLVERHVVDDQQRGWSGAGLGAQSLGGSHPQHRRQWQ
jgi:hypothetical protein